jgi:DNA-binding NtrC family response regulator
LFIYIKIAGNFTVFVEIYYRGYIMAKKNVTILVVDDEPNIRRVLEAVLIRDGFNAITAENGRKGLELLKDDTNIDLMLTDLIMPDINGIELLEAAKEAKPDMPVVMMTAHGTIKSAVDSMRLGAFDYITKPFDLEEIKLVIKNALNRKEKETSVKPHKQAPDFTMIGSSPAMQEINKMIERIKDSRASVLIRGESGTGKEGVAKALHFASIRAKKPFVPVACVALSEQLLQSELFGHEKGSFTGSVGMRKGRFEMANDGTLFLDEIGDIPPTIQMMLLRVIQEREFERVGGNEIIKVNVRLVTATNQSLEKLVKDGKFREDLFYRLQVITINMPPLRDRKEDIPELAKHFISIYAPDNAKDITGIEENTMQKLLKYDWPGNVRELENAIERAIVLADFDSKLITLDLLPGSIVGL